MGSQLIYWTTFSWEAFAALATGLVAVIAAWRIGLKQIGIMDRQVASQELAVRIELYDRRYSVFDRARNFILRVMQHGDFITDVTAVSFQLAVVESKFLFCQPVYDGLNEIWKEACQLNKIQTDMTHSYNSTRQYGEENINAQVDLNIWFSKTLNNLPTLFSELQIVAALHHS